MTLVLAGRSGPRPARLGVLDDLELYNTLRNIRSDNTKPTTKRGLPCGLFGACERGLSIGRMSRREREFLEPQDRCDRRAFFCYQRPLYQDVVVLDWG